MVGNKKQSNKVWFAIMTGNKRYIVLADNAEVASRKATSAAKKDGLKNQVVVSVKFEGIVDIF